MDITYTLMLPILQFLDKTLGSYGWAILGLTLAIRIAVWPLVAASTKSMQRMGQVGPKMKQLQEKYKERPEVLQRKMAEFYMKNKINPLGGCLPLLVQLPILFALFGTFNGPPFQDKPIPVTVKLLSPENAQKTAVTLAPSSSADSVYVSKSAETSKLVVRPGDSTLVFGRNAEGQPTSDGFNSIDYTVNAVQGRLSSDFKPDWKIAHDPSAATMNAVGQATFPVEGDITVEARIPAELTGGEDGVIQVKVKVLPAPKQNGGIFTIGGGGNDQGEQGTKEKQAQSATSVEITAEGNKARLAVEPGDMTLVAGKNMDFRLKALEGSIPKGFHPRWRIAADPNASTIDENGKAIFRHAGEVRVEAIIHGEAKNEPFYFISNIGKVAKGMELLDPKNWDVLGLILLFAVTMVLSQKLMVTPTPTDPEQAAIQKQTQQVMPITLTAMFFFMPLPAGVFLYMVFSNIVQTLQTWMLSKQPPPPLIDIEDSDVDEGGDGTITVHPKDAEGGPGGGTRALTDKSEKNHTKSGGKEKEGSSGKSDDNTEGSTIKLNKEEKQGKKR